MTPDDDGIRGRLDEDQEHLLAAVAPYGFELRQPRKRPLEEYHLKAFPSADTVLTRLTGKVDGALVDVFEYDWVQPGSKGAIHRGRKIVTILRHPAFEGEARATWKTFQSIYGKLIIWLLTATFAVILFWLLVPIWLWQYFKGNNPFPRDRRVGNPDFERRFKVNGPSLEAAKRALPRGVQALVVAEHLKGPIEVRPGMLAFGLDDQVLDASTFEKAMHLSKRVVAAYATRTRQRTAYRVGTDIAFEMEDAEHAEAAKPKLSR